MPVLGRCRLCLRQAELQKSHLLPRYSYKRLRGRDRGPTVITNGGGISSSRQIQEHLLCMNCEQRFGRHEDIVARLVSQTDATMPWRDLLEPVDEEEAGPLVFACPGVDTAAVTAFGVSVVWRSAVFRTHEGARLGPYEDPIRRYLVGETSMPSSILVHVGLLAPPTRKPSFDRICEVPSSRRHGAYHVHAFAFLGAVFFVVAGNVLPHEMQDSFCLTGRVTLLPNEVFAGRAMEMAREYLRRYPRR